MDRAPSHHTKTDRSAVFLEETSHFMMEGFACKRIERWARFRVNLTGGILVGKALCLGKAVSSKRAFALKMDVQIVPEHADEALITLTNGISSLCRNWPRWIALAVSDLDVPGEWKGLDKE